MISVVIPNLNGKHFLEICLKSIYNQSFGDVEVILIDNASNDDSVKFVLNEYPKVKIVVNNENLGFSKAVNQGIKAANGDLIFLLNNDTELHIDCLKALNNAAQDKKDASIFASKMLYFDERNIINDVGDIFSIYAIAHQQGKGEVDNGQYNAERYIFGACAGAAMYRADLFQEIGLFDEDFFAYLEDVDVSFRSQIYGRKCLYVPNAVVYHVDGGTSKKINNFSRYYTTRNVLYLITKNFPWKILLLLSPFILLGQLRNLIGSIKNKSFGLFVKSYYEYFFNFCSLIKKRRKILTNKKVSDKYIISILDKKYPFSILKSLGLRK